MDGARATRRVAVLCLAALLLVGVPIRGGSGASTARAQGVEAGPAAATPVAVPPVFQEPVVALVVERAETAFGDVTGRGEIDPAVTGVTSSVDEAGAFYVKHGAIRVVVSSDGPWTGACHAGENGGSATTIRVGDGRLAWRLADTEAWIPFGTSAANPAAAACFTERAVGSTSYTYDLRLRVERDDPPGTFAAAITYAVEPERSA